MMLKKKKENRIEKRTFLALTNVPDYRTAALRTTELIHEPVVRRVSCTAYWALRNIKLLERGSRFKCLYKTVSNFAKLLFKHHFQLVRFDVPYLYKTILASRDQKIRHFRAQHETDGRRVVHFSRIQRLVVSDVDCMHMATRVAALNE
jgi:hypothetical protein